MRGSQTRLWALAIAATLRRQAQAELCATPLRAFYLGGPRPEGFAASPPDLRPIDPARGQALLNGVFDLGGERLQIRPGGDPWDQASPSRRFARRLHRFDWLGDLMALGDPGVREALRLTLEWRRVFGAWNAFSWSADILERRVFNLGCAARRLCAQASDLEAAMVAEALAQQARFLLAQHEGPRRAAERLAAAAVAGAALAGRAGDKLMDAATGRLEAALEQAVLADGGHASRSPQAGLELLFDLLALDDGLSQRGRPPAEGLSRAIDRLSAGARFFTLPDGRLAAFQGGEAGEARRTAAALAHDDAGPGPAPREAPHAGYQRLIGRRLQVIADTGPPAAGGWSATACGQPMAIEVICGRDRLITNVGWSERALGPQALRLAAGGSTAAVGDGVIGAPLGGYLARALGPRLVGGVAAVKIERRETDTGVWLEMSHEGWRRRAALTHERRLYIDKATDELRGEDRFAPDERASARTTPVAIHFHLRPDVRVSLARDQRSVLLRGPSNVGWWLRNDAEEVAVEPSTCFEAGQPCRTAQVVLRSRLRTDRGGRVRWKLTMAEG